MAVAAVLLPRGIHGVFVDLTRWIQRRRGRKPVAPSVGRAGPETRPRARHDRPAVRAPAAATSPRGASRSTSLWGEGMTVHPAQGATAPAAPGRSRAGARDVAVHFGGVKAVDGITLRLEPGLIYGIIGPNGSERRR